MKTKFNYAKDFKKYLADLSKKTVSPGGGSAAALVSSCGISLLQMAVIYSAANNKTLVNAHKRLEEIKKKNLLLIDLDAEIFADVMEKATAKNKQQLNKVTFDLAKNCITILKLAKKFSPKIKKTIISDFNLGAKMVLLGVDASIENLEANEKFFKLNNKKKINSLKKALKEL